MEIDALKIKVRLSFVPTCTVSGLVSLVYMAMRQTLIGGSQVLTSHVVIAARLLLSDDCFNTCCWLQ